LLKGVLFRMTSAVVSVSSITLKHARK
jgi:hypothetical protein